MSPAATFAAISHHEVSVRTFEEVYWLLVLYNLLTYLVLQTRKS